jgi:spore germination cell wall hydrolase CwlJ-like protein
MLSVHNRSIKEFTDQQQDILLSLYQDPQTNGEGLGVNIMTKDKRSISGAQWTATIITALMFGAFLGSPVPEDWTGRLVHYISSDNLIHEEAAAATEVVTAAVTASAVEMAASASAAGITASETPASPPVVDTLAYPAVVDTANRGGAADRKEKDVLIRLINAEAYGLSYKAKLAVGQVVMNRYTGPYYGDDLMAIMTAPHQFTPIYDGSAYDKEIEPDSVKAANAVLSGGGVEELTADTYYFVNPDFTEDKTIENEMEFVCEIEGIHFYRPPSE